MRMILDKHQFQIVSHIFLHHNYNVGTLWNCDIEVILICNDNICVMNERLYIRCSYFTYKYSYRTVLVHRLIGIFIDCMLINGP